MSFVTGLRCRECARLVSRLKRCTCVTFASVRSRSSTTTTALSRSTCRAGSGSHPALQTIWRYADLLPVDDHVSDRPRRRNDAAREGGPARHLSSGSVSSGSKTTLSNPTGSFKDRVVSRWLSPRRASSGSRSRPARPPAISPTAVAAHAARAGMQSVVFVPHDLEKAKIVTTAVYGGLVVAVAKAPTTT
jgi:threonine synthase